MKVARRAVAALAAVAATTALAGEVGPSGSGAVLIHRQEEISGTLFDKFGKKEQQLFSPPIIWTKLKVYAIV